MAHWELIVFFFVIAFVYASVGFGGGSSYVALLAVYNLPVPELKLTALVCNVIVVTGGVIIYAGKRQLNFRKIIPLVVVSIPMAYLGATLKMKDDRYFQLLGCSLILASFFLWLRSKPFNETNSTPTPLAIARDAALGGSVGFLAGVTSIGGGIFLSPVLNILRWDMPRKIAATSSVFILVNSISGIAGQMSSFNSKLDYASMTFLCSSVFIGGQLGSRVGTSKFSQENVKRVTALLVLIAGIDVLWKHMHF